MQHIELQAQAQQLRDSGLSTRKIAAQLGVSQPWVTRHTTAATDKAAKSAPSDKRDIAVARVLAKATSPQGCNVSEFNAIIKDVYGTIWDEDSSRFVVDCDSRARKSIKRSAQTAAERDGKIALFFEDFLDRQNPLASNQLMLTLAQDLHERVELLVSEYRDEYPDITVFAIQSALVRLAIPGYKQESVESFCERNAAAAHALQQVAPTVEAVKTVTEHTDKFLADLADIDAELFGSAGAPASTLPVITHEEYREDVAAPVVEEGDDEEVCLEDVSLDDLEDDESMINPHAVDMDWIDMDDRYTPDTAVQQGIRDLLAGRQAERTARATGPKRPSDWAIKQAEEDAFYEMLADAESHNTNFIF